MVEPAFVGQARALAELWATRNQDKRKQALKAIRDDGLLAIGVYEMMPRRADANARNEIALALAGNKLELVAERAGRLARAWTSNPQTHARIVEGLEKSGALAVWTFGLLPPPGDEGDGRYELANALLLRRNPELADDSPPVSKPPPPKESPEIPETLRKGPKPAPKAGRKKTGPLARLADGLKGLGLKKPSESDGN